MPSVPDHSSHVPLAYLNGEFLPYSEARLPVFDLGIVQAATVTERLRTVRHRPYLVEEHIDRLKQSLQMVGWGLPQDSGPLTDVIHSLAAANSEGISAEDDLAIVIFVTAGQALGDANGLARASRPTVCVYTAPLPLVAWAPGYRTGVSLVTPAVRHIPGTVISPRIKHRSRLHWLLADHEVRATHPGGMALLLDEHDCVTETASGNIMVVTNGELLTPREETTLGGIAQSVVCRIARSQGWTVRRADLNIDEVTRADEAFLTSSTYCILPVSELNGVRIGTAVPGRVTKMLIDNWGQEIGLDFEWQSLRAG